MSCEKPFIEVRSHPKEEEKKMYSGRVRFLEILSRMLVAYMIIAFVAGFGTTIRLRYLRSAPVELGLRVSLSRPTLRNVAARIRFDQIRDPVSGHFDSPYYIPPSQMSRAEELDKEEIEWRRQMRRKAFGAPIQRRSRDHPSSFGNVNNNAAVCETDSTEEHCRQRSEEEGGKMGQGIPTSTSHSESGQPKENEDVPNPSTFDGGWERNVKIYEYSSCTKTNVEYNGWKKGEKVAQQNEKGERDSEVEGCSPSMPDPTFIVREVDTLQFNVSGMLDFSRSWDWNTKAIYVAILVRYSTPATPVNELTLVDVVLRSSKRRHRGLGLLGSLLSIFSSDSPAEWKKSKPSPAAYNEHLRTLRNEHDPPGCVQDPDSKLIFFKDAWKYPWESYQSGTLPFRTVEVVVRYQVMSYSGWAPLNEISIYPHPQDNQLLSVPRYEFGHDKDAFED